MIINVIYKPTSTIYEAITTYEVANISTCLYYTQQNGGFGVCSYTGRWTLRSLQHCSNWIVTCTSILELGSGTSVSLCKWLAPIGGLCEALVARKNSVGRRRKRKRIWKERWCKNSLWRFSPTCTPDCLWVRCCVHRLEIRLSMAVYCSSPPSFRYMLRPNRTDTLR